jgi:OOP family OmpA-OmpF porin
MGKAKKTLTTLAAGAVLWALSGAALSQQEGRFYLGAGFGQATANDFCDDVRSEGPSLGLSVASCDEKDSAFKFFVGYRVNPNFAIEGSYFNYGEASFAGQFSGLPLSTSAESTAFGIAAVGILPVGSRFSLFGKLGLLMSDIDVSVNVAGFPGSDSESETGLHFGIGAMFDVSQNVAVRAEWERNDELEVDMLSVGLQVRF